MSKRADGSTGNEHGLECPYCNHVHRPENTDYDIYYLDREDWGEWECSNCGRMFKASVNVSFDWDAEPMPDTEEE